MHETTQISYGLGTVDIILNIESPNSFYEPNFHFTDYEQVLYSCLTQKELEQISDGEHAEITFNLNLTNIPDMDITSSLSRFIEISDRFYNDLENGIFLNLEAYKSLEGGEPIKIEKFSEKTAFQLEIPTDLVKDGREFFLYTDSLGGTELYEDIDKELTTLSVNAGTIGNSVLLYREKSFISASAPGRLPTPNPQYLCVVGIVLLLLLWKRIDFLHKKE